MAYLLGARQVKSLAGSRVLLDQVTLGVEDGMRIGILGPNGAGKSTLLRLLAGKQQPEGGSIVHTEGVRVSVLEQADSLDPTKSVRDTIHPGIPEYQWATERRIRDIHSGLLSGIALDTLVSELSGGQRRRVGLAAVLVDSAQVIMLDEPTNHLDVAGVDWLARHLNQRFTKTGSAEPGALVVVTHDRWVLDAICTRVWEVIPGADLDNGRPQIPGRVTTYDGSYAAYVLARAERGRQAAVAADKRSNLLRKELAWLRRGPPARTSKPRFRIEAAEQLIADVPPPRDQVELLRMATARLGKQVIDLEDVTLTYPGSDSRKPLTIFQDVTWRLSPAERVGVVGVNGSGKTTLLRLLEGLAEPTKGRVKRGKTVQVAVLSQTTHELDEVAHLRVVEAVSAIAQTMVVAGKEITASQLVERLGFTRERAWTSVAELSGGERRRLQLMRLLLSEPNVLLLDEPTNDLDTDTLAAMEDLLDSFPGTLVVVSHDRYLLERITDHQVALLGDMSIKALPGGVEQYLELCSAGSEGEKPAATAGGPDSSHRTANTSLAAQRRTIQKTASRLERKLDRVRAQIEQLHAAMETASERVAVDPTQVTVLTELARELSSAEAQLEQLELDWLEAAGALE